MKDYKTIKEAVIHQSKELNTPLIELLNDIAYVIDLCNEFSISVEVAILMTKRIELESC